MSLYACTTIGGTRYLAEWLNGIKRLSPNIIVISRDTSRSENIIDDIVVDKVKIIDFDSKIIWNSYELRHLDWKSDESILQGFILLLEDFIASGLDFFIHVDSDIILDEESIRQMIQQYNDYIQFSVPVVPRDLPPEKWAEWTKHVMGFNETTNISISRRLAIDAIENIKKLNGNAYPVDIKIQYCLKDAYYRLPNAHSTLVVSKGLAHYIKGVRVNL